MMCRCGKTALNVPDGVLLLEPRSMFDKALIGFAHQAGIIYAVYSRSKTISALGPPWEESREHYDFNVSGSIGVGYPVFMMDDDDDGLYPGV